MPSIQPWVTCELTLLSFSAVWRCPVYNAVPDPHLEIRVVPRGRVHRTFYGGWRSGTLGWRTLVRRGKKTSVARRCLQKDFWQHRGWWGLGRNASQNSVASLQCTEAGSIKARGRGGRKTRFVPEPRLRPAIIPGRRPLYFPGQISPCLISVLDLRRSFESHFY